MLIFNKCYPFYYENGRRSKNWRINKAYDLYI